MTSDDDTYIAAHAHDRLRHRLLHDFAYMPLDVIGAALAYELASVVATAAPTQADAIELLSTFYDTGVRQIRALGVGKPHP